MSLNRLFVLLPFVLLGCGRTPLLGFDNGCPDGHADCTPPVRDGSVRDGFGQSDDFFFFPDDGPQNDDGGGSDDDGGSGNSDGGGFDGSFGDGGGGGDGGFVGDGGKIGDGGFVGDGGKVGDGGLVGDGGKGGDGGVVGDGGSFGDGAIGDGGKPGDGGAVDGGKPDLVMCGMQEICNNGKDDDCNGVADCVDKACQGNQACIDHKTELCNNGIDDNNDGLIDCVDPQCAGDPACVKLGREICNNGIDDNDNGLVDCADPQCFTDPVCKMGMGNEICNNGIDDNNNGLVDCADPQCAAFPACLHAACNADFVFGTLPPHDGKLTHAQTTSGAVRSFQTCAAPGGTAVVGEFTNADLADVRLDFTQAMGGAHVVSVFRAGNLQSCDQNLVYCLQAGQMPVATHTLAGLPAGLYRVIVQSYPGTQGASTVTLSTGASMKTELCNNGVDDDGNGLIDCADLACRNDPNCINKECVPDINVGALVVNGPGQMADFDTHNSTNRYHPTCAGTSTGNDEVVRFTLKETAGVLVQWTQTGDHVFGLFTTPPAGQACDANQISCYYPGGAAGGAVAYQAKPPGDYVFIFKPAKAGLEGHMHLTISAYKNRQIEICDNGIDDDGNGLVDCADPACYGVGNCKAPLCMPDVDLGNLDYGDVRQASLDLHGALDLYSTKCGKGNGIERVVRITLLHPMALGFNCTQTGDQVLQLDAQINPLDLCDANRLVCADPKILPFGCNFAIPNLQAGHYNVIVEAFQSGSEGTVNLTLSGIQEKVLEICDNGIDDDNDGFIDCADRKCVTDAHCAKFACRADKRLGLLPLNGMVTSTVVQTQGNGDNQTMTPCVTAAGGEDAVADFELPAKADLVVEWAQVGNHDFALYQDSNDLLACEANPIADCHASMGAGTGKYTITKLPAGKYHFVVDADKAGAEGGVVLQFSGMPSP